MVRIAGIDLQDNKRIDIALTKIYGIGRSNVLPILKKAGIEPNRRTKELSETEIGVLQKTLENLAKVEGDLRQEVQGNIRRLRQIGAYRGIRHSRNLPVRGQRTRSNARTKRGKRVTIGAIKKDDRIRTGETEAATAEKK